MTEPIGLHEAIEIVRSCDEDNLISLVENPQLINFFDRLNECGTDVLKDMGYDVGYAATEFVQISTVMQLLSFHKNDPLKMFQIISLLDNDLFQKAITLAFKSGIGLAVTEELH